MPITQDQVNAVLQVVKQAIAGSGQRAELRVRELVITVDAAGNLHPSFDQHAGSGGKKT